MDSAYRKGELMGKNAKRKKRLARIASERLLAQHCGCDCHNAKWPLENRFKPCNLCELNHIPMSASDAVQETLSPSERYQTHSHAEPNTYTTNYNRCSACHALIDPSAISCPYCMTIQP